MHRFQKQIYRKYPIISVKSVYKLDRCSLFSVLMDIYFNNNSVASFKMDLPPFIYMQNNCTVEFHFKYVNKTSIELMYKHFEK